MLVPLVSLTAGQSSPPILDNSSSFQVAETVKLNIQAHRMNGQKVVLNKEDARTKEYLPSARDAVFFNDRWSLYYDFHLFSGYGKSRFQHGNPIMQADAFPCSRLMVSGQIVPSERNLACISGCRNCHFARCSCDDGMASPQKYLITCSREEK